MARSCGDCSMCCKVLHIAEFDKPANQWCPHIANGGGCGIYDTRYATCRGFQCLWTLNEDLGPEWQPHRSKFIIHRVATNPGLWINVDKSQPLAWKNQPFYRQIKEWAAAARDGSGFVAVCVGDRTTLVFPEEDLLVPDIPEGADLKVGYRHTGGGRRPLVMVRSPDGSIAEHLGAPIAA